MPTATTQTIPKIRDPSYYFKHQNRKQKEKQKKKPVPWVDVSDDDQSSKSKATSRGNGKEKHHHQHQHQNSKHSLKRKNSFVNGHSEHSSNSKHEHKHKKRRHSLAASTASGSGSGPASASVNDTVDEHDTPPPVDSLSPPPSSMNGLGPVPGSSKKAHLNGSSAGPSTSHSNSSSAKAKAQAIQEQRAQLPIAKGKDKIIEEIRKNEVTILLGETGSGKTTQIPQYILTSLFPSLIGITQPRKVAATSLASRVASETQTPLGSLVGYSVRFDDRTSPSTRIKYLTDGMLVREMMADPLLGGYGVIVVDEAHERTLRTDVIIANLKKILRVRNGGGGDDGAKGKGADKAPFNPLKVVIMSATLDAEKFSKFFNNAPILYVKGRQHPVKIYHAAQPQLDYTDAALRTFFQIHTDQPPGDVLVFLPGQEDIEALKTSIELYAKQLPVDKPGVLVCTMFAAQDPSHTSAAFLPAPPHTRKVILATNIAETSITIPGITYVIDTGKHKSKHHLSRLTGGGFDTLLTTDITKSSASQRAGRAGREGPGVCFRLYTEEAFRAMKDADEPEVLRVSLVGSILGMKCLGQEMVELDMLDKPDMESIASALKTLWLLGALDNTQSLTPLGKKMSLFPLDPPLACALLASSSHPPPTTSHVLTLVSLLSTTSKPFLPLTAQERERLHEKTDTSSSNPRAAFTHPHSDHLTLLAAYSAYSEIALTENKASRRAWCRKHGINERAFLEARDIRRQLVEVCRRAGVAVEEGQEKSGAANTNTGTNTSTSTKDWEDWVIRSLGHGLAGNSAFLQPDGTYKQTMGQTIVKIHPSSVLVDKKVPAIIYDELIYTNQIYARGVSAIPKSFFLSLDAFKQRKA
ncbi:hypothetical protein CVT26_012922 [Gymnopilus dilepis]|uniref:RNA helicase n=1 Tax=Gymnopilus dilepis TaxID=231916 RepID=A0A409Y4E8_9AGAR|nr:hypothetical protein CVT26_012922 [Gymnopilus dilepis]